MPDEDIVALEGCGDLDGYEIDSVGIIHNYYLKQIFSNFDFDATDPLNEYYNNYIGLTIMADGFALDSLVKDTLYNEFGPNLKDLEYYDAYINDPDVYDVIDEIELAIDTFTHLTYLISRLEDIESDVVNNFSCSDRELLLVSISVAKKSAELWAPTSYGGEGFLHDEFFKDDEIQDRTPWWKRAILGDVTAAGAAFLGIGISGAIIASTIPAGAAALGTIVGVSAAIGSGLAVLTGG